MTLAELAGRELDAVLGTADLRLFTPDKRVEAINAAQDEFNRLTRCFVRDFSVSLATYDPTTLLVISNIPDFIDLSQRNLPFILSDVSGVITTVAAGEDFPRRSTDWLDRFQPGWRNSSNTGTPQAWFVKQNGTDTLMGLVPAPSIPAGAVWTITIPYFALPDDIVDDGDEPFSTDGFASPSLQIYHSTLALYAGYLLEPLRKGEAQAAVHLAKFNRVVDRFNHEPQTFGPQHVTFARNYLQEANRRSINDDLGDPRR